MNSVHLELKYLHSSPIGLGTERKGLPGPLKGGVILEFLAAQFQFHVLPRKCSKHRNASNSFDIISTCLRTSHPKVRDGPI